MFMTKYLYEKELRKKEVLKSPEFRQLVGQVQELINQKKDQDQNNLFPTPPMVSAPPRDREDNFTPPPMAGPSRQAPVPATSPTVVTLSPDHPPPVARTFDCTPVAASDLVHWRQQPHLPSHWYPWIHLLSHRYQWIHLS
jgi:hypothetical protein